LRIPQRVEKATVVAQEGLPITKTLDWIDLSFQPEIKVPADAWADWDAVKQVPITVGEKYPDGTTAKVLTTVCYPADLFDKVKWHDGSPLTLADFVFQWIATIDPGKEDSPNYDAAVAETVSAFLAHFKGFKISSTDPLCIENYDDLYQLDAENNINDLTSWWPEQFTYGTGAWHSVGLGLQADADGKLAFSADKADAKGVEWMSMIAGPSLEILKGYLDTATAENYIPYAPTMGQYVTADEAAARYANLAIWYTERNHFWIGTGPFYLYRVFPVEQTVTLQRNPDFPDMANKWSNYGEPKIPVAEVDGPGQIAAGEEATFDVFVTFKEQPYPVAELAKVSYLVFDANGTLVTSGDATNVAEGQYQVVLGSDVTGAMASGSYKMEVAAVSNLVSVPGFASFEFIVP
jgi:peptide/nickel transport system substrate-binding protein